MNIQLRDSKTLQDAMRSKQHRNAIPKAQLHPMLENVYLDVESGGFIVRSEENHVDAWNMEQFLPKPSACSASWVKSGRGDSAIPSELIFSMECRGKLVIRTQAASDVSRLTNVIPSDRSATFNAEYTDGRIVFVRTSTDKQSPTSSKNDAELQLEAARAGVKWDKKASRETMIERIDEAKNALKA